VSTLANAASPPSTESVESGQSEPSSRSTTVATASELGASVTPLPSSLSHLQLRLRVYDKHLFGKTLIGERILNFDQMWQMTMEGKDEWITIHGKQGKQPTAQVEARKKDSEGSEAHQQSTADERDGESQSRSSSTSSRVSQSRAYSTILESSRDTDDPSAPPHPSSSSLSTIQHASTFHSYMHERDDQHPRAQQSHHHHSSCGRGELHVKFALDTETLRTLIQKHEMAAKDSSNKEAKMSNHNVLQGIGEDADGSHVTTISSHGVGSLWGRMRRHVLSPTRMTRRSNSDDLREINQKGLEQIHADDETNVKPHQVDHDIAPAESVPMGKQSSSIESSSSSSSTSSPISPHATSESVVHHPDLTYANQLLISPTPTRRTSQTETDKQSQIRDGHVPSALTSPGQHVQPQSSPSINPTKRLEFDSPNSIRQTTGDGDGRNLLKRVDNVEQLPSPMPSTHDGCDDAKDDNNYSAPSLPPPTLGLTPGSDGYNKDDAASVTRPSSSSTMKPHDHTRLADLQHRLRELERGQWLSEDQRMQLGQIIAQQKTQLREMEKKMKDADTSHATSMARMQHDLHLRERDLTTARSDVERLTVTLTNLKLNHARDVESLRTQLHQATSEASALRAYRTESSAYIRSLHESVNSAEMERRGMKAELESRQVRMREKERRWEEERQRMKQKLAVVKEEMEEAQREVANGRKYNHALEQEIEQFYATLAEHESTIAQLRSELASHHSQLHSAFHSLSSAQSRQSAQLGIALLDVMRQIKQKKQELKAVEARRVEEENKLKQVLNEQNEIQQLSDRNAELDARCHAQQQLIQALQASHTHAAHVMEEEMRTMRQRAAANPTLSSSRMQTSMQMDEPSHPTLIAPHSHLLPSSSSLLRSLATSAHSSDANWAHLSLNLAMAMDAATVDASSRPSDAPSG